MKTFGRPKGGPALHINEILHQMHTYAWDGWQPEALAARLRDRARHDKNTAEAYSILREIIRRGTGLSLFDTQLMAAHAMAQGRVAELPTGEGKTLAAVVTAALLALRGRTVHILVFNDYLAQRDYDANRPLYTACGLTCGCIVEATPPAARKAAYACDVLYIAAKEAGFDCLRDFLCMDSGALLCPPLDAALVDEADSILIDEARIPLVLAGNAAQSPAVTLQISRAVAALSSQDVGLIAENHQVWLTDSGAAAMEAALGIDNLFLPEHANTLAMVSAALEARFLLRQDRDYIVQDGAILVVDESTGRVADHRRFPDLLHQAVEIQALGAGEAASAIYNTISMQAYLRQYAFLCGMTGTAATSAYEFRQMYGLAIDVIPPHIPCIRVDHPDAVYRTKAEQEAALLQRIRDAYAKGQPLLIGTQSVAESEHFSALLSAIPIPHSVLNARSSAQEAAIIAEAGRPHQVTISTNMAGRGVDIRLGGRDAAEAAAARAAGGLLVLSTGMGRSIRIDHQLRGRSGRQGDPGESQCFVCLEDLTLDTASGLEGYGDKAFPRLLRRAQRAQERKDIEARYMLERYASILEGQRKRITAHRMALLRGEAAPAILQAEDPAAHRELVARAGARGVALAERQLTLYFINTNWALYLEAMEAMRGGIHLLVIGKKSPLDEYMLFAASAFDEMLHDIRHDVMEQMKRCHITENGIDMEKEGLLGATTTWTYMINESSTQFSRIPQIVQAMSTTVKGTLFTFRGLYEKLRKRLRGR